MKLLASLDSGGNPNSSMVMNLTSAQVFVLLGIPEEERFLLTQEGYLVTHCVDIKSAKTTLYENNFDLAILDLSLPDGSGYDLCRLIKAKEDIPVIF
ncbi:response regulator [Desulfosporosinus shakirovi]|uniref:response regulator n=1 Tax=Desulfosporosinus shakirovi TaxID=2885154 RepID=UPI0037BFAD25